LRRVATALSLALALSGCGVLRGCTSTRPPIHINPSMDDQPKALPQASSGFFYDGSELRLPVEGTVARGELREDDAFFKGLIQFAGAFVHLQKHSARYRRLRPAAALFRLARTNLQHYPALHQGLDLQRLVGIAEEWIAQIEADNFTENPFTGDNAPQFTLNESSGPG
jgi:hypothetical protein